MGKNSSADWGSACEKAGALCLAFKWRFRSLEIMIILICTLSYFKSICCPVHQRHTVNYSNGCAFVNKRSWNGSLENPRISLTIGDLESTQRQTGGYLAFVPWMDATNYNTISNKPYYYNADTIR